MRHWLIFLFSVTTLSSVAAPTIVTENDPSTLVEGVSVITGDFYLGEEDYLVGGAEPISIRRFYLSGVGSINQYPHLIATFALAMNKLLVNEPNGTEVIYSADSANKFRGLIGREFYDKKKRPLKYHFYSDKKQLESSFLMVHLRGKQLLKLPTSLGAKGFLQTYFQLII